MTMHYDTATIRQFLLERFNDGELNDLCFDYFPDVYQDFTEGMAKRQKVRLLLEHSRQHERLSALMAAMRRERPQIYNEQFISVPREGINERTDHSPVLRDPHQIFISHAHQDAKLAHRLADDLQQRGWSVWVAPDSIQPGEKWVEAINRGLEECGTFILLLTPEAVHSRWVISETNAAIVLEHHGKIAFLPLRIKSVELPPLWQEYQQIPFQTNYVIGLNLLLNQLGSPKKQQPSLEIEEVTLPQVESTFPQNQIADKDVEKLELGSKKLEFKLTQRYQRMIDALSTEDWVEAVIQGWQIQQLDDNYRDVRRLMLLARKRMQKSSR